MPKKISRGRYTAGEFAKLAGITKKTLHYYDELGLFQPAEVGENGYRYYFFYQLDRLSVIITLRDLGVSLQEIRSYLNGGSFEALEQVLSAQERELAALIDTLRRRQALLHTQLGAIRSFHENLEKGCVVIEFEEERADPLPLIRDQLSGTAVTYATDGPGVIMELAGSGEEFRLLRKQTSGAVQLPEGRFLCLFGSPESGSTTVQSVLAPRQQLQDYAAAHGMTLDSRFFVEFNELLPGSDTRDFYCVRCRILAENPDVSPAKFNKL